MKKPKLVALCGGRNKSDAARAKIEAFCRETTVDVLARTLWGEARGEGSRGMEAVACVILNRVARAEEEGGFWWGNTIVQVCQKPYQFSCWNRSDPNYKALLAADEADLYFASALRVARRALAGALEDITNGATHYHADHMTPYWAKGETPCAKVGRHVFYRL